MIRKANIKDLKFIKKLIDSAAKEGKILKRSKEELESIIGCFFVYEEGRKILGCVSLEIYSEKLAEIRSLVVNSKYQGRGIGSALVKECIKKAKKLKIYEILSVTHKDKMFESLGFSKQLKDQWPLFIRLRKSY